MSEERAFECAPPFEWALGVCVSEDPTDLSSMAVGFQTRLRRNLSYLHVFPTFISARLYSLDYSTDTLTPRSLVDGQAGVEFDLHLRRPPRCWVIVNKVRRRASEVDFEFDGGYELDDSVRAGKSFKGILASGEMASACKIGRWLMHRFTMQESGIVPLLEYMEAHKYASLLRISEPLKFASTKSRTLLKYTPLPHNLPGSLKYAIDGLLTAGVIADYQVPVLLELLLAENTDTTTALRLINLIYHKRRIYNLRKVIDDLKGQILKRPIEPATDHMVLVAKLVITPTRVLMYPPEQQTSNFVLRSFPEQTKDGRFLRVQFWDESGRLKMGYESKNDDVDSNEGILARFRRCLKHGVTVGARVYWPLDYSSSQCREHAFWAVCEDKETGFTRKSIRDFLGDFSKEMIPAKNAARRGQLYSTSYDAGEVANIVEISDFISEEGSVYSDGCGLASRDILTRAMLACGIKTIENEPIACQVRIAGAKGMLVAWSLPPKNSDGSLKYPDLDWPKLEADTVALRPSQIKFQAKHKNIGVIKCSSFMPGFLNREVLVILFSLGIKSSLVLQLFESQASQISMKAENEHVKVDLANAQHQRIIRSSSLDIVSLIQVGLQDEPCIQSIIRLCFLRALYDLREKAKIFIEDAVQLFGVIDELGVLEEGQIYCKIQSPTCSKVVTGTSVIFRAPTRHPGDVQLVQAVDHPALRDSGLVNVIIFPRKGLRDLASCLGGGDLDGDSFVLIWDKNFTGIRAEPPADYTPPDPIRSDSKVTAEMTREFHTFYMKTDKLGAISNSHLAMADRNGPGHDDCRELANLHSIAVDLAKTGVPAELPNDLKPAEWPDFMGERRFDKVYQSQSPLGLMYRHHLVNPFPPRKAVEHLSLNEKIAKYASKKEGVMDFVEKLRLSYELELNALMARFEVEEESVISGTILPLPGGLRRLDKEDKARDPLDACWKALSKEHYSAATKSAKPKAIAATAYVNTYEANLKRPVKYRRHSFPFIFHLELAEIMAEM